MGRFLWVRFWPVVSRAPQVKVRPEAGRMLQSKVRVTKVCFGLGSAGFPRPRDRPWAGRPLRSRDRVTKDTCPQDRFRPLGQYNSVKYTTQGYSLIKQRSLRLLQFKELWLPRLALVFNYLRLSSRR